ncbi:hypothetical protein [Leptospira interrogans]|uniref:hypothetical protein n=1 Tax=Leptospira interrogans TaxID=173 RepID=UPI000AC3FAC1|nr:hypothetical protein [Leptospira interrogans]
MWELLLSNKEPQINLRKCGNYYFQTKNRKSILENVGILLSNKEPQSILENVGTTTFKQRTANQS